MTQDITQLPWVLHKESNCIKSNFDRPDDMVAMPPFKGLESHENWEANAAFIVRACNNHKALLDALKSMRANFEPFTSNQIDRGNPLARIEYESQITASERARAAIANAENE